MQNLAGQHCNEQVVAELAQAGIPPVVEARPQRHREPVTDYGGALHGWSFTRAWYYWTARTQQPRQRIPLREAKALHERLGAEVRTDGHAGGIPPNGPVQCYHIDSAEGLKAFADLLNKLNSEQPA